MAIPKASFAQEYTGDTKLDRIQSEVKSLRGVLAGLSSIASGKLIDAEEGKSTGSGLVFVAGTSRSIRHGLGRKAVGFIEVQAVDISNAAPVGLSSAAFAAGYSSDSYVSVLPVKSGTCFLFVF